VDELYKHLGIDKVGDPDFVLEKNWFNQFPIYEPGHMDRAQRLIMLMDKLKCGVQIGGTTLFASAIPELVMQSKFLVDKL
jgi:protoporphyrinogen oxidase